MHALNHAGNEENARYMSHFQETLDSIPLVKAFAAEEKAVGGIMDSLRQVFRVSVERSVGALTGLALSSTPSLTNFAVFVLGAYWVISGHWSLGTMFAFQAYLGYVFGPAQSLASINMRMQSARASLERVSALFEAGHEENVGKGEAVETLEGGGGIPGRLLRLRSGKPRRRGDLLPGPAGRAGGHRGAERRGEDNATEPHPPILQPHRRGDPL